MSSYRFTSQQAGSSDLQVFLAEIILIVSGDY